MAWWTVSNSAFFDDKRKLDTALLGGQSEASVETDAEKEFVKLQGVQIDALMLAKYAAERAPETGGVLCGGLH